jgi:hypothetical protein
MQEREIKNPSFSKSIKGSFIELMAEVKKRFKPMTEKEKTDYCIKWYKQNLMKRRHFMALLLMDEEAMNVFEKGGFTIIDKHRRELLYFLLSMNRRILNSYGLSKSRKVEYSMGRLQLTWERVMGGEYADSN